MFGVTHVCAVDGHSGRIVGFVMMPIKNNITIYECLYRWVEVKLIPFAKKYEINVSSLVSH